MVKNKEENKKDAKSKEKLKKEKKSLKKSIKAQDKREKELDKREKKLRKKEKQLEKKEQELFYMINNHESGINAEPILDAAEQASSLNKSDHLLTDEPIKQANTEAKKAIESIDSGDGERNRKNPRSKPLRSKKENKATEESKRSNTEKPSTEFTVREGISEIKKIDNEQQLRDFLKGDDRKTIVDAGERRAKKLSS